MDLSQIISSVIPAIITGLISYYRAVKTSNNEIEKLRVSHKHEIEKMEKELELQREKIEIDKKTGENEMLNSVLGSYMNDLVKGKSLQELGALSQEFQKYAPKN